MKECNTLIESDETVLDYEADNLLQDSLEPASPRSQELRDFEAYNRTTLPILVEANLRAIVESQIAPIEERVRAMVVDIVRTCQSTVARNFLTISSPSSNNSQLQSSSQIKPSIENSVHSHRDSTQLSMDGMGGNSLDFFREPPHLNAEASALVPDLTHAPYSVTESQSQNSDSGYGSLPNTCGCSCHHYLNTSNLANGKKLLYCVMDPLLMRYLRPLSLSTMCF